MTDREKLIKLLNEIENHPEKTCPHINDNDCFDCKYDTVNDRCDMTARKADYLIANGVTVQNQWISVEDGLPIQKGKYLCLWNYHSEDVKPSADVLYFDGINFPWEEARKDVRVSHWRQLPELP